jgi:hypothetical protein
MTAWNLGMMGLLLLGGVAQEDPRAVELTVTEYSNVVFQVLRGAPAGKRGAQGETNQKKGTWSENGTRAMTVCAFLFAASRPIVDVVPDEPKGGEALECKIVAPGEDHQGRVLSKYDYVWKRFEGKDWIVQSGSEGPRLAAGRTQAGERWSCWVRSVAESGAKSYEMMDEVEIGKDKPGDCRANFNWGWTHGQWRHLRGYLKFDLASLAGKKVRSARLRLFCTVQGASPFSLEAYAAPNTWSETTITWVQQPLKFPFEGRPVGTHPLQRGPEPTPENPANESHGPKGGPWLAPTWREIDLTAYVGKAMADRQKEISICLTCKNPDDNPPADGDKYDHHRVAIFNDKHREGEKDRGDLRPRLTLVLE